MKFFIGVFMSKLKFTFKLLIALMLSTSSHAGQLAIPIGPPQRISPVPGPANPDPVLQNLKAVMDDFFQLPTFPGGRPDYLSQVTGIFNCYLVSPFGPVFNPIDDRIMSIPIGQNVITGGGIFSSSIATNTIATSFDRGKSWTYGPPVEQTMSLGGTISQVINGSFGPGLYRQYDKNGKLYAFGHGFMDLHPNPPNQIPLTGFLFTKSCNNGKTWAHPRTIFTSDVNWWIFRGPNGAVGNGPWDFGLTIDPACPNLFHAAYSSMVFPEEKYGDLFYTSSFDAGKTFLPFRKVYSMVDDPLWLSEHFDPDFTSDPNYFIYGGLSIASAFPVVLEKDVILYSFLRQYPPVGSLTYLDPTNPNLDFVNDMASIISFDNGKTWSKVAGATPQFLETVVHDPGVPNFIRTFSDNTSQGTWPLVSPYTGRVYISYQANNPAIDPDPLVNQFYPRIVLNSSSDKGRTWSKTVQVNRTPTNIPIGAQQAFDRGAAFTKDGCFVVAYYDFRNWTGVSGENEFTTPLPTDCWLAVYKEVDDPNGGSTGVGLDFIEELRVTPESFNARRQRLSPTGFLTGTFEGIPVMVNNNNELFVFFSTTNQPPSPPLRSRGYRGMIIDLNNPFNILMQRYQFPKPSNQ